MGYPRATIATTSGDAHSRTNAVIVNTRMTAVSAICRSGGTVVSVLSVVRSVVRLGGFAVAVPSEGAWG